ncbi:hypothetical protein GGR56DRAFT_671836 [Xylariaceae sp. FL0804]|nr:hypothetical protein GGR56DRAFT_671836 [Xylariaceae sp. FL0804]
MENVECRNHMTYIRPLLDVQADKGSKVLDVKCHMCWENRLDISRHARGSPEKASLVEAFGWRLRNRVERTLVLPCGHVFGDRCVHQMMAGLGKCRNYASGAVPKCPDCGYKLQYKACGHRLAPATVPVRGQAPLAGAIPLTMGEASSRDGGDAAAQAAAAKSARPDHCPDCRGRRIQIQLDRLLPEECTLCVGDEDGSPPGSKHGSSTNPQAAGGTQGDGSAPPTTCTNCSTQTTPRWRRNPEGQPLCDACGLAEHARHRAAHLDEGVAAGLRSLARLVHPGMVTPGASSSSSSSSLSSRAEVERAAAADVLSRESHVKMLRAVVQTSVLAETVWRRTRLGDVEGEGEDGAVRGSGPEEKEGRSRKPGEHEHLEARKEINAQVREWFWEPRSRRMW